MPVRRNRPPDIETDSGEVIPRHVLVTQAIEKLRGVGKSSIDSADPTEYKHERFMQILDLQPTWMARTTDEPPEAVYNYFVRGERVGYLQIEGDGTISGHATSDNESTDLYLAADDLAEAVQGMETLFQAKQN